MWREREKTRDGRSLPECPEAPGMMDLVSAVSVAHLVAWDTWDSVTSEEEVEAVYRDIQAGAERLGAVAGRLSAHLTQGAHMYRAINGK